MKVKDIINELKNFNEDEDIFFEVKSYNMSKMRNIILVILIILTLFLFAYSISQNYMSTNSGSDFTFLCNPYYGKYDCKGHFFINATGNYCNGKLICENLLKK